MTVSLITSLVLVGSIILSSKVSANAATCSESDSTGTIYTGTLNDKGECIYDNTHRNNAGTHAGDPGVNYCGDVNKNAVVVSIDLGCKHKGNAILDALFAIIRFLTLGVSLVIIGSMIVAGIQFTASRGDPQATAAAIKRMSSSASALLLFIFIYAILNWLVPNTLLQ